ncbi:MAG: toll/interleukin-1 receptor domain-containing protein [Rhodocyclaceae bacterium]|nr:toll/interleukin-1 receptor domain-containing protein [Rhodocyclaceae bacterium]MCW5617081.1 toll/interleukin-1 receptor domain-containing protein [Rhodocyclaceae bacterium]
MADIFVSYRRGDSAGHTGRLVDSLVRHFGSEAVFQDVQSISVGSRWDDAIRDGVVQCRLLLAVIGRDWLVPRSDGRPRIDDSQDPVRQEILAALERGIAVIPVLVEGAQMPAETALPEDLRPLARWQAHELSDSRWAFDTERLMQMIERVVGIAPATPATASSGAAGSRKLAIAGVAGLAALSGAAWLMWPADGTVKISPPVAAPAVVAPAPAEQAPLAPVNFEGSWYDEEAADWTIRVKQDKVEINHTAPGSGTAIGFAEGTIRDRTISFDYVMMVPDEPHYNGQLVLSDDGTRLTGVLSDVKNGGNTRVLLHRRSP